MALDNENTESYLVIIFNLYIFINVCTFVLFLLYQQIFTLYVLPYFFTLFYKVI